jgi:Effector-associated domain 4/NB-ARC domain
MPSQSKRSYGADVQARVKSLVKALLDAVDMGQPVTGLEWTWSDETSKTPKLMVETTLKDLVLLANPRLKANTDEFKRDKSQAGESLGYLRDFLEILDDQRLKKRGSDQWRFTLRLWGKDVDRNLNEFDKLWESKRSPHSKSKSATAPPQTSGLKPGAPYPRLRLPENFVDRPDAIAAVKNLLLAENSTVVVSAIAGLGGLGKSVLATALVLDPEVRSRFADGILWVTLGQNPDLQAMLGDWIGALDKSQESYSATTLESASRYLETLLIEKRVLLVVDDAWNASHVEHFRVGGAGCRILVTTREAQIGGAEYYPLAGGAGSRGEGVCQGGGVFAVGVGFGGEFGGGWGDLGGVAIGV